MVLVVLLLVLLVLVFLDEALNSFARLAIAHDNDESALA